MEPIEQQTFQVDSHRREALHKDWVREEAFLPYLTLPLLHNEEELMNWLMSTDLILEDLQYLLNQPCHVFWSYLIFCDTLKANLDGFLKVSPRDFDGLAGEQELLKQHRRLYETYFKVFVRMTTCKESSQHYLTPRVFGIILYDNFILDLPKIIDMCALFGSANRKILVKMIENVFKHQPKYLCDVEQAVPALFKLFKDLIQKLADDKLIEPRDLSISEVRSADVDILDLSLYASDMCHSLHCFLQVFPPACQPFHQSNFYKILLTFYEDVLCKLLDQLESSTLRVEDEKIAYKRLSSSMDECVSLFRHILFNSTLARTLSESSSPQVDVQDYYDIMTESLGDVRFIGHYAHMFSFDEDLEIIANLNIQSDLTRQSFIKEGLEAARIQRDAELEKSTQQNKQSDVVKPVSRGAGSSEVASGAQSTAIAGAVAAPNPSQNSISSPSMIAELFPHIGAGFIEMCLRHFNSVEDVVSALLEDNLPQSLRKLDQSMPIAPEDDSLVNSRRNVFDNDEFDVLRHGITDTSKVHRGKRSSKLSTPDAVQKEKIRELVTSYDQLEMRENGAIGTFDDGMYDDEYDDTYDANEVGADDADEALELMGRKMVVPIALGGSGAVAELDDETENGRQHVGQDGNNLNHERPKYDVKGRAKGQGQSTDVVRNRNFKTAHKARGANHNRKAGARSKMSKGMF